MNDGQKFNTYRLSLNETAEIRLALKHQAERFGLETTLGRDLLKLRNRLLGQPVVMIHHHQER